MSTDQQNEPPLLARTITKLRLRANLTQAELARRMTTTRSYLFELEKGRAGKAKKVVHPRPDTLRRIANALAMDGLTREINREMSDRHYQKLGEAAGYLPTQSPDLVAPARPRRLSPQVRAYALIARLPQFATAFDVIPDDFDEDDLEMLRQHLELSLNQVRRRKGLPPITLEL